MEFLNLVNKFSDFWYDEIIEFLLFCLFWGIGLGG